jgi:hypothetical protein
MKPGDFLLGVLDVFAILLPGVVATWLLVQYIPTPVLRDTLSLGIVGQEDLSGWVIGAAFFLSSYTLGHFVFMIGSRLDSTYDGWRRRTMPDTRDSTYLAARALQRTLNGEIEDRTFSTLKWAKAYIQVKAQHARLEIDRLEADQKFFRSLVVISAAVAAHFLVGEAAPVAGLAAIGMGVLSYRRYLDQRWKMSELIYATALIVHKATASGASTGSAGGERREEP